MNQGLENKIKHKQIIKREFHAETARIHVNMLSMNQNLPWETHLQKKHDKLNIRFRFMFRLFSIINKLTLRNKRLLYIAILCPVWTYALQLRECVVDTNNLIIQYVQNKILRKMTGVSWYVSNEQLHRDFNVDDFKTITSEYAKAYEK